MWDAVHGELSTDDLDEVTAHATTCSSCAEEWRLALDVSRNHVVEDTASPSWLRWAMPVAAMLILGLVVVPMWRSIDRPDPAEFRTRPAAVGLHSMVPEGEPLGRDDCELRWSGPDGAVYEIVVAMEDTTVLVRASNVREPRFQVPTNSLERVPDGGTIVWHVRARSPDGSRPAPLTVRTRIEATGP